MNDMRKRFFGVAATSLFTMVLLPLIVLGLAVGAVNNHVLRREIDQSNARQIRFVSERVSGVTGDLEKLNQSLSTNPAVTLRLKSAMQHAARGGIQESEYAVYNAVLDLIYASSYRNKYVDSIYLYFEDGERYFISSKKRLTNLDEYEDTQWYEDYLSSDPFVGTWASMRQVNTADGESRRFLTIYHRIFAGGTGSDRGVLVLNIDQSYMNELLDSLNGGWHTASCVSDASGNVLFSNSEYRARFAQNGTTPDEVETAGLDADELTRLDVTIQKEKYVCLMQPLSVYGWRMIFLSPVESLYQAPNRVFQIMLLMLAVTMLFGVWFTYQLARQNSRDINNVIRSIQRAKQGKTVEKSKGEQEDYSVMLQNVVDTFLEKEYLSVQLAERRHHAKLLELQALQMQLNPHFLYNTMSTIQWRTMALTGGRNDASDMIENLSDLLHYVLDSRTEWATLREELAVTESYVAIQKIRHQNQFDYICCCPQEAMDARVMKMMLQPLVENSISHGMKEDERLNVRVNVELNGDYLCIRVSDDGEGIDEEKLKQVRKGLKSAYTENGRHIGLYNVNKRITLVYGETYGVEIESGYGKGTTITLKLPLVKDEALFKNGEA